MQELTDTVHNVGQIGEYITGRTAPRTEDYYREVYIGIDATTGVPLLEVTKHATGTPAVFTGEIPTASLELIPVRELSVPTPGQEWQAYTQEHGSLLGHATTTKENSFLGEIPWVSFIVAIALGALVWFVYRIIRIWQDYQAQMAVLTAGVPTTPISVDTYKNTPQVVAPASGTIEETVEDMRITDDSAVVVGGASWREELRNAEQTLQQLLDNAGVTGDTMNDKLKSVSAGQFASVDLAWEAHQATRDLFATADRDVSPSAIMRAKSLYRQVFADHGLL